MNNSFIMACHRKIHWIIPILLLILFYSPGLFFGKIDHPPIHDTVVNNTNIDHEQHIYYFNQDKSFQNIPFWYYKKWAIENGHSLEWNDLMFSGLPLWPQTAYDFFTFRTLFTLPFSPTYSYVLSHFLQGLFLLTFCNLVLAQFRLPAFCRLISTCAAVLCRESLAHQQSSYTDYWVWFMAGLWILFKIWKEPHHLNWLKYSTLGGLILGWGLYTNHPLYFALMLMALFVIMIWLTLLTPEGRFRVPEKRIVWAYLIMVVSLTLISAWQWLPTLEMISNSYRTMSDKGTFFPMFMRFKLFAVPTYDDLSIVLNKWFNIETPSPFEQYFMVMLDGHYLSLTVFFFALLVLFYKPIRRMTAPLWLSYITIVFGYNFFAFLMIFGAARAIVNHLPLIHSVHLNGILLFSTAIVWILSGFGFYVFIRTLKRSFNHRLLVLWVVCLLLYTGGALYKSMGVQNMINEQILQFTQNQSHEWHPSIVEAVESNATELKTRWIPMPFMMLVTVLLLYVDCLCLYLWKYTRWRMPLIYILSISLFLSGIVALSDRIQWTDRDKLIPSSPLIETIAERGDGRALFYRKPITPERLNAILTEGNQQPDLSLSNYLRLTRFFCPAISLYYNVEDINGISPQNLRDYHLFLNTDKKMETLIRGMPSNPKAVNLLNTRYIVTPHEPDFPHWEHIQSHNGVHLYHNTQAVQRVYFAPQSTVIEDRKAILDSIQKGQFDPSTVILETPVSSLEMKHQTQYGYRPYVPSKRNGETKWVRKYGLFERLWLPRVEPNPSEAFMTSDSVECIIQWIEKKPGVRQLKVNADGNGWLVFSDIFYPGWRLNIDGEPVDIYRAFFTLMATPIKAGEHEIELAFRSGSRDFGKAISLVSLIVVLIIFVAAIMKSKKTNKNIA